MPTAGQCRVAATVAGLVGARRARLCTGKNCSGWLTALLAVHNCASQDTVLQDMYGEKAEKMAKQMAVAALYEDSSDTARVVDHVLGKRQVLRCPFAAAR